MTDRKHMDSGVVCGGCGREFGIIMHSHISRCPGLQRLGITTCMQYKLHFGRLKSDAAIRSSAEIIRSFNASMTDTERRAHARVAYEASIAKYPDLCQMGVASPRHGSKLWPDERRRAQGERCKKIRPIEFVKGVPNKLETKFWDLIGRDLIEYKSFSFWKTIVTEKSSFSITPDFVVKNQNKVVEVYGDYWHRNDDPHDRIHLWESVGMGCLVVWEDWIKKNPDIVRDGVMRFIGRNFQERGTPILKSDEDIVQTAMKVAEVGNKMPNGQADEKEYLNDGSRRRSVVRNSTAKISSNCLGGPEADNKGEGNVL